MADNGTINQAPVLPTPPKPPRRRVGSILVPLTLIAVGVLFMLETLGVMQQSAWELLWRLWPVIFFAIALDGLLRRKEIFGPVFWTGLGGVFLLTNFGILNWEAWNVLFRMWPLLLVTAGLEIILGRRNILLSALVVGVVLAILAVALGLTGINMPQAPKSINSVSQPIGDATRGEISLTMGAGEFRVASVVDAAMLISGDVSSGDGDFVQERVTQRGDTIVYQLENNMPEFVIPFENDWTWDLGISSSIPVELASNLGAGEMELALEDLDLDDLDVNQAVGSVEVFLPEGDYGAKVNMAVGEIVIWLPEDYPIRVDITRAITGLELPSDFVRDGAFYYSPNAKGADEYIALEINEAVGSIDLRYLK